MGKNAEFDALGKAAGEVAVRFMKREKVDSELLRLNTALLEDLLEDMMKSARRSADARLEGKDADALLAIVNGKIFDALARKQYKPQEKYASWARRVAVNAFIDYIGRKRGAKAAAGVDGPVDRLVPIAESLGEEELEEGHYRPEMRAWGDDPEASLLDRDIFNLIFRAVLDITNDDYAAVFVSRIILGQSLSAIAEMFDMAPKTPQNYYFRALEHMEESVEADPDYGGFPVRGLADWVATRFELRPGDIESLRPDQRRAIELAREPGVELPELASRLGLSETAAGRLVREAAIALARLRIRRAEKSKAGTETEAAVWLWDAVEDVLAAYPRSPERTRSEGKRGDNLLALSELAVRYFYGGPGAARAKSLGELVREHLDSSRRKEAALALGIPEHKVMGLVADRLKPSELTPEFLAKIASFLRLSQKAVQEAARIAPRKGFSGQTRGASLYDSKRQGHLLSRIRGR